MLLAVGLWDLCIQASYAQLQFTRDYPEQANELSRAGCIGFIPKPFVAEEFLRLVAEILNATTGRNRRGESPRGA